MNQKQILRVGYTTKKYEISKGDIDQKNFEILLNRRDIRKNSIRRLFENLVQGKHFDSPFVVNTKNGKWRLIDGNHRFEAIKKYLFSNPENKVEVTLNQYEDLDDQEEKDLFTAWNLGRKQNTNDVVKQYEDDILIFKIIKKEGFPVQVSSYNNSQGITFFKLVGAYLSAIEPRFQGGFIGTPWDFVKASQQLGHKDYLLMKAFMKDFLAAFGVIKNNRFSRTTPFNAIFCIWIDNRENILLPKMISYFKLKLVNDAVADQLGSMSGRGACIYVRNEYLRLLNNNRTTDIFVKREDMDDEGDKENDEVYIRRLNI